MPRIIDDYDEIGDVLPEMQADTSRAASSDGPVERADSNLIKKKRKERSFYMTNSTSSIRERRSQDFESDALDATRLTTSGTSATRATSS